MKIFKEKVHSVLPRPFGVGGKMILGVGIMVFFDLTDPESLLTEQDLWKAVPGQLGPKPIVDVGMPKPRGEVLVAGSCFAPKGEMRLASQVCIRVGDVNKSLHIFGDRFWKKGLITDPEPFTEIPLVWTNAFGGQEFKKNPLGKGMAKLPMPNGGQAIPLPNIEDPRHLIGSPGDRPEPAGMGPLDMMCPQRAQKNGTYGKRWLEQRWPYLPDDMNYEFFNAAPEDQYIVGFFQGGEPLTIENMHPDMLVIESALPRLRLRCFATLNPAFKPHTFPTAPLGSEPPRETDEFREITTRLETVWLFPSILRGLCIYRGTTEIIDEDYGDVLRIMIRHEDPDEEPKSIEYYRDLQTRLLDRGVDIDLSGIEETLKKQESSLKRVRNIPKFVDEIRQKALGNRPLMPMMEPEEFLAKTKNMMGEHLARIDELEAMTRKMHGEYGHLMEFNLGIFDKFRHTIANVSTKVEQSVSNLTQTKQKILEVQKTARQKISAKIKGIQAEHPGKINLDPDVVFPVEFPPPKKVNPWHDRGFPIVANCRKMLENDRAAMKAVKNLGFESRTVRRSWLGLISEELVQMTADWGLEDDTSFTVAPGLVVPRFDGPVLTRMVVFPEADRHVFNGKPSVTPGSDETPLFLPCATLIDLPTLTPADSAPVVVAADDLQALFVEQEAGDCCSVMAMGAPAEKPSREAAEALKAAPAMLIILPAEWDKSQAGLGRWAAWQAAWPQAQPLTLKYGETVFENRAKGSDIRSLILELLPVDYAAEHSTAIGMPEKGKPPDKNFLKDLKMPFPADMTGLINGVFDEVKAAKTAKFADMKADKDKVLLKVKDRLAEFADKGVKIDPDKIISPQPPQGEVSFAEHGRMIAGRIRDSIARQKQQGRLAPAMEARMNEQADTVESQMAEAEAKRQAMKVEFAAKKKELEDGLKKLRAGELPEEAKEKFKEHGMDLDKMKSRTREEVAAMHAKGHSLDQAILNGVDLSGLDLSRADLSKCRLNKTIFRNAILDGAKFNQCMGKETDFSGASMKGADLSQAMLNDSRFHKADLTGAVCHSTTLKKADLSAAVLADADMDMAILQGADLTGVDLTGARLNMCIADVKAQGAVFRQAEITKCLFKKAELDGADFGEASIHHCLLNGVVGKDVNFAKANLDHIRTGSNSQLPKADFSHASLKQAGLRDTDLTGATFVGADLEQALVENCILVDADLTGASAKAARFSKSNLERAVMRNFNLMHGSLRKARLVQADLRGSNLYGVDFYKSVVGGTRFEGTNLKKTQLYNRLDLLEKQ